VLDLPIPPARWALARLSSDAMSTSFAVAVGHFRVARDALPEHAEARGTRGSGVEYVRDIAHHLRASGIDDPVTIDPGPFVAASAAPMSAFLD
jgi:cation transport regulator ChaC